MLQSLSPGFRKFIQMAAITVGVYLGMRYLLGYIFPFVLGLLLVRLLNPLLSFLRNKIHLGKGLTASVILFLAGCVPLLLAILAGRFLLVNIAGIRDCYSSAVDQCNACFDRCVAFLEDAGIAGGKELTDMLHEGEAYVEDILLVQGLPLLSGYCLRIVKIISAIGIVWAVIVIFCTMLVKEYDSLRERLHREDWFAPVYRIGKGVCDMLKAYFKTQLIMFLIIAATVTAGVWIMGYPYPWLIGPGIGFLDALPFIGTGITLVPMAVWNVITGRLLRAAGCILLYIICMVLRDYLEPKIMGKNSGIHPILLLMTIYLGIRLYGIVGILTGPVSYLLIREIYREISDRESRV